MDEDTIRELLKKHTGWKYENGSLQKEYVFKNFRIAFSFMTAAALTAEKMDHHPDWRNVYNKLHVSLNTHDAGGITENDFRLAAAMDQILRDGF
jgi:4a-hydroxytetrahydrobiopterin dehydratase